jgi:hypothetical protein
MIAAAEGHADAGSSPRATSCAAELAAFVSVWQAIP